MYIVEVAVKTNRGPDDFDAGPATDVHNVVGHRYILAIVFQADTLAGVMPDSIVRYLNPATAIGGGVLDINTLIRVVIDQVIDQPRTGVSPIQADPGCVTIDYIAQDFSGVRCKVNAVASIAIDAIVLHGSILGDDPRGVGKHQILPPGARAQEAIRTDQRVRTRCVRVDSSRVCCGDVAIQLCVVPNIEPIVIVVDRRIVKDLDAIGTTVVIHVDPGAVVPGEVVEDLSSAVDSGRQTGPIVVGQVVSHDCAVRAVHTYADAKLRANLVGDISGDHQTDAIQIKAGILVSARFACGAVGDVVDHSSIVRREIVVELEANCRIVSSHIVFKMQTMGIAGI